jgi:hypothetical protein
MRLALASELDLHPVEEIGVPKGLGAKLAMFCAAGCPIIDFRRDTARAGELFFELPDLLKGDEMIFGAREYKYIGLDPLGCSSE